MANVFHYRNENKEKYDALVCKAKRVRRVGFGVLVGLVVYSYVFPISCLMLCMDFVGACVLMYVLYKHSVLMARADILRSGFVGERVVCKELSSLPDEYTVITNVPICCGKNRSEVDALVMSPYGMCVVEVKNHKGIIEGERSDKEWKQYKNGRLKRMIRNPIFQMRNQKRILLGMNKMKNLSVPIYGLVVFPSALEVKVSADEVLNGLEDLNSFVQKKHVVRVNPVELCRLIKAYGVDLSQVVGDVAHFYRENCPELLEGIG